MSNPSRVNVNRGLVNNNDSVTPAQLRRRTEGENFTYQIEIQGISDPGISVDSQGVIAGTLSAQPGDYTIVIMITRDIDGHTEVGIRRLHLIVR